MDYILYFILTVGILVFVHEFGHFAAAKLSKMRVDVFAIGFGKRLFGWNKIKGFTFGDLPKDLDLEGNTDYRLSLLPLGGYVKIAGMVDESFDTEFTSQEPKEYEFRSKSTLAKLFVISAGVLMNLLLAFIIFWGANFFKGQQLIKTTEVGIVNADSPAAKAGFMTNDKILTVNNETVNYWDDVRNLLFVKTLGQDVPVKVLRNSEEVTFTVNRSLIPKDESAITFLPISQLQPMITEVMENSPAEESKLKSNDIILKIDDQNISNSQEVIKNISAKAGKTISLVILRSEDTISANVTPGIEGKIGIGIVDAYTGPFEYKTFGFFTSIVNSVENITNVSVLTFTTLGKVIKGDVEFKQAFGGPVRIAQWAAKSADSGLDTFLGFLAILSLSLALINILPFPVLDGGHIVIILIEGIIKRELPIKVKLAIQNTGFVLLLLLMAFIIYNDIISL